MLTFANFCSFCSFLLPFCRFLKMAGNSPHGRGFSGAGDDFDPMSLPPRSRPFMPERYRPAVHALPRAVFRHFTSFDERAPTDLLLREMLLWLSKKQICGCSLMRLERYLPHLLYFTFCALAMFKQLACDIVLSLHL